MCSFKFTGEGLLNANKFLFGINFWENLKEEDKLLELFSQLLILRVSELSSSLLSITVSKLEISAFILLLLL